jgi:hypothetical protein
MFKHVPRLAQAGVALLLLTVSAPAAAQPDNVNFRFNSGQPVQPIYEGWQRNPADGSISMFFGYINRSYAQDLSIPVGLDNSFAPGPADHGQPTLFYSRIHRQAFSVKLPAVWGKTQELTWTVTANGVTLKAVGWMQPEWEIDAVTAGQTQNAEARANKPPAMAIEVPATASLSDKLTLTATVTDDGLPKPRAKKSVAIGQESPPTLQSLPDDPEIPTNVPDAYDPGRVRRGDGPQGLRVSWIVWRGPAAVVFAPQAGAAVTADKAVVTAAFRQPGTYVLRARASDGALSSGFQDVTVTVTP